MRTFRAVLCLVPFLLAACASGGDKPKDVVKIPHECPQTVIVRELDHVRDYGVENAEDKNLLAEAEMLRVDKLRCAFDEDLNGLDVHVILQMKATRGARLDGDTISFPYFITIIRPDQTMLVKKMMDATFVFHGQGATTDHEEALHVFVPLPKDALSGDYQILTGFQLSHAQLDAARKAEDSRIEIIMRGGK